MRNIIIEQRSSDYADGYLAALREIEPAMLQSARDLKNAFDRGYEEGRSSSALVPFVFLCAGGFVGFVVGALVS